MKPPATKPASASRASAAGHRLSVVSRLLAAAAGGYALANLLILAVPLVLAAFGVNRAESLLAVAMASFLVHAGIIMAVFHARSATRAWLWLLIAAIPPGIVTALLQPGATQWP